MGYYVGIDVGGTFTDFIASHVTHGISIVKVPSTPEDPSIAVMEGLKRLAGEHGLARDSFIEEIDLIVHGTTVATNAVLRRKGAKVGLLTTKGFRDVLQMRRGGVKPQQELYNNRYNPPPPLVGRSLRISITERVAYDGNVLEELAVEEVQEAAAAFKRDGVEAVAISFMHSYANPSHEKHAAEIIEKALPETYLSVSADILPQIRFFDRTSTAALNSYVGPILKDYIDHLTERLTGAGFGSVLLIMQSNGGVVSPVVAKSWAVCNLLSGPAAGPIAGLWFSSLHGYDRCVTIDMGGTSFDTSLAKDGVPLVITEGLVNDYLTALPMLDISTIGAGGGSIAWIDAGGLLRVGPDSAGAVPGPVCYGKGGELPTCTDATLVLGYLDKEYFHGGTMTLDYEGAWKAIEDHLAKPLGLSVVEAAAGVYEVINSNMVAGIKEVTIDRGLDPRDFPLVV